MADSPSPTAPVVIGHYRIVERLGAGGMGVVYKALDLKLERPVALKFLPEELSLDEREKEHLLREARAASALDHPNIGVIYGIEENDQRQLFIVMAFYEGETLTRVMSRGLTVSDRLSYIEQIARGLSAAHEQKIVHRDVKPSNVIITQGRVAKIVDFGLARVVASSSATQTLRSSGTIPYMSPEQVLGEPVGPSCDVWALGIILIQMFTGNHPFRRENATAMSFAILNQPPEGLEELPEQLQPIAYRALAKDPKFRYADAGAMLADLEAVRGEIDPTDPSVRLNAPTRTSTSISARELERYAEYANTPRWGAKPKSRRGLYLVLTVVVALLVVAALVPQIREPITALLRPAPSNHIAVLPFDNLGGDPANDALAAGLMDSLTGELSNINAGERTLWVVPSSVVRSRKVNDPAAAAKAFGVNLVVKGSIQRSAQSVRLTVDLIDAQNLREIGSATLEDRTGDIGSLQDEAVSRLAGLMKIKVTPEMLRATAGHASPAAYEMYLQALGYMQRYDKPGNLDRAISALNDSVRSDPQFALGFASLGEAYRLKNQVDPNRKWIDQALANLQLAVQANDHLPSAFVSLGRLHMSMGKTDLALQEFERALGINARDPDAITARALGYEHMGRIREAEQELKRAAALRPDYWDGYNTLGWFYFRQGRNPDAIAQFERVLQLTPDNATAYSNLAGVYLSGNDPQSQKQAEEALKHSLQLAPSYPAYANLGTLLLRQRRFQESAEMTRKALEMNDHDYLVWSNLLIAYEWLHDDAHANEARARTIALEEEFVALHPQDATVHSSLAIAYAESKQNDRATRHIDAALALHPDDSGVLTDVAEAYEDMGDRKRALEFVHKSMRKGTTLQDLTTRPGFQSLVSDPSLGPH